MPLSQLEEHNRQLDELRLYLQKRNRELMEKAQKATMEERFRLDRDIHSETLNGIAHVIRLVKQLNRGDLQEILELLEKIKKDTRRIVKNLWPTALEEHGFSQALEALASELSQSPLYRVHVYQ